MKRPNVLFILTDDQRYDTIHALGNPRIQTPNLDALCADGMAFTNAHIPGGTVPAVCMPSRAMIHTGRSLFSLEQDGKQIPRNHALLGETFRQNGYRTFGTGKWHNGTDSFTRSFAEGGEIFFGGMWDHWNVPVYEFRADGKYDQINSACIGQYFSNKTTVTRATHIHMGYHSTDLFTDQAIQWLREYQDEKPFFLYLSYLAPHDPRTMPAEYANLYNPEDMVLECFAGEHFRYGIEDVRDEIIEAYPRKVDAVKQHVADYYAMISHLDARIGDLIALLKEKGLYEDTIIVFTGDNGLAVGRHGLMGKQSCYEHGIRIPLVMAGPGIPKDAREDGYHFLYDLFPTLCSLCGLDIPDTVEGMDFSPVFQGIPCQRDEVYAIFGDKVRTVKDRRYKLIEYRFQKVKVTQLFDLEMDPYETRNLADDPAYQDIRLRLTQRLQECGDSPEEQRHKAGKTFWGRYRHDPDFVEPEVVSWLVTMYKPDR
ncbi:MAG: sulfatase-like hydrolase/transferase [Lawsonibacter sp.]|jgi:arylsulfatase A-like enzyme